MNIARQAFFACALFCAPLSAQIIQSPLTIDLTGQILLNGQPFRAIGTNYYDSFRRALLNVNDTSYRQGFADLSTKGVPFARLQACPFYPSEYSLYLTNKAEYYRRMDDVVAAAQTNHVGLVLDLFWYWPTVPDLVGESANQWGNLNSRTIAFMRQYTTEMVTRYLNSPAVWVWEFGNEYNLIIDVPTSDGLPPTVVSLGEPATRTDADRITHDILVTALTDFGNTVRKIDAYRPITTGNSAPRASAYSLRTTGKFIQDSKSLFQKSLLDETPDPCNLVSFHLYPNYPTGTVSYFGNSNEAVSDLLILSESAANQAGKGFYFGEFGASSLNAPAGDADVRAEWNSLISAITTANVSMSGFWSYSISAGGLALPNQAIWNVTQTNNRSYMLDDVQRFNLSPITNPGRLNNISVLTPLALNETMTIGTVLGGPGTSGTKALLARAAGPSLTQFGITPVLQNPTMTLNNTGANPAVVLATNTGWGGTTNLSAAFAAVGAFPYASTASKDSAVFLPTLGAGNYTMQVADAAGGSGTVIAELYDSTASSAFTATTPRLINVSVLKQIAAGGSLTAGFVVGGSSSMRVLVRAVGPTLGLAPFNLQGVMASPQLTLVSTSVTPNVTVATNNGWGGSATLKAVFTAVGAFQLASETTKDSALFLILAPGNYTAQVSPASGTAGGTAIVEVYAVP